jgi:hypothetical protein
MNKEKKQVTVASAFPDHYEIYEDGSMKAWCKRCNNPEELPAERAEKVRKIPDWSSSFTCTPCWKKSKEPASNDKQEQIAFGQSWNLAVALVAPKFIPSDEDATLDSVWQNEIERWQKYFYSKLTNR